MRIIITGTKGYLATSLADYFIKRNNSTVLLLDVKNNSWGDTSFKEFDLIIHCAALVHKNEKLYSLAEYEKINTKLTVDLAKKAKSDGVKHFIFISTMAVYGSRISCFLKNEITDKTDCVPKTKYGISKYKAENEIVKLKDERFIVSIVRPPFVYGKNCPGNYVTLKKLVLKLGIVPKIKNLKSMIYIGNLCELMLRISELEYSSIYMPQNNPMLSTAELSQLIAEYNGRKVLFSAVFKPFVYIASLFLPPVRKAFGNEFYSMQLSKEIPFDYNLFDCEASIKITEGK